MCGRFYLEESSHKGLNLDDRISVEYGEKLPSNKALIMTYNESNTMKWGLPYDNKLVINARSESLFSKKMFLELIKSKRCVIPANWFYDWKNGVKYKISLKEEQIFYMAGIYGKYINKENKVENGFVIITASANKEMSEIHHRIPVMLNEEEKYTYLNPDSDMGDIKELLRAVKDGSLDIVADSGSEQLSLF
ncbi:SOS response-associated peptidase [Clostridium fungisolvens]|uniref:Abasic site processing protein n=1 Tax=Clostridium fungisolvens TaxID=1604897 RepID=A0A6V8SIT8_9CLOT|nr:SOS response-associated peptidase family protein [Clostridium fungisolvens]GFP74803.1 SOS response-associated protein YedK [Clostridium fungisolvens]